MSYMKGSDPFRADVYMFTSLKKEAALPGASTRLYKGSGFKVTDDPLGGAFLPVERRGVTTSPCFGLKPGNSIPLPECRCPLGRITHLQDAAALEDLDKSSACGLSLATGARIVLVLRPVSHVLTHEDNSRIRGKKHEFVSTQGEVKGVGLPLAEKLEKTTSQQMFVNKPLLGPLPMLFTLIDMYYFDKPRVTGQKLERES
ncbi:unnamed protein product [Pleuronectes platessa]|uniref:Uncharacterized protein n=1 Tax=Pleuronectes platessa TaxID=8262 RepID=A0A9N7YJS3_PLEPL|nr:unnamed protein product [Pleuronectes platessa]